MMKMLGKRDYILITTSLFLLMMAFAMTGCNTMEGVGRDLESVGQAIDDTF